MLLLLSAATSDIHGWWSPPRQCEIADEAVCSHYPVAVSAACDAAVSPHVVATSSHELSCCAAIPTPFTGNSDWAETAGAWGYIHHWNVNIGHELQKHWRGKQGRPGYLQQRGWQLCEAAHVASAASALRYNALGLDLSDSPLSAVAELHRAYYGFSVADASTPYEEVKRVFDEDQQTMRWSSALPPPPRSNRYLSHLAEHGYVQIQRYEGLDVGQLRREVDSALWHRGDGVTDDDELAYFGDPLPALEPVLRNTEIRTAVSMYLGGGHRSVEVTGYSILHLGRRVSTERCNSAGPRTLVYHRASLTVDQRSRPCCERRLRQLAS